MYEGARATGEVTSITAGEPPKVMTKEITLLGDRHGAGKATFPKGDLYEGEFFAGSRDGEGKYVYAAPPPPEGEDPKPPIAEYAGKWMAGAKSGVGMATYATGHKYQGMWKDGKFDGLGTMFYPNGDIFTGAWVAGKKTGLGTYIFKASKTRIRGEWVDNKILNGAFKDQFNNKYVGEFATLADDGAKQNFVEGGVFNLCNGATDVYTHSKLGGNFTF